MDSQILHEQLVRQVEAGLQTALEAGHRAGLDRDQVVEILDGLIYAERQE